MKSHPGSSSGAVMSFPIADIPVTTGPWWDKWKQVLAYKVETGSWPSGEHPALGRFITTTRRHYTKGDILSAEQALALRRAKFPKESERAGPPAGEGKHLSQVFSQLEAGQPIDQKIVIDLGQRYVDGQLSERTAQRLRAYGVSIV